jgi:hypothetical protein
MGTSVGQPNTGKVAFQLSSFIAKVKKSLIHDAPNRECI